MDLLKPVKALCARLAASSKWRSLLAKHGFKLDAVDLAAELQKPLTVNRTLLGFDDFADDGKRAIEPASPSRSLLYHALASPNVLTDPAGMPLDLFPTPAELDAVENYIFGVANRSLAGVQALFPGKKLTVVVFSYEYRAAAQTCHGRHADAVFARTGVSRVGTVAARYVPELRGFHPEVPADPFGIAVSPARYVAYLAVLRTGNENKTFLMSLQPGDGTRQFWLPLHKLFDGKECLQGLDLKLTYSASHVNEKLFRAHKLLPKPPGTPAPPTTSPFRFTDGLADVSTQAAHGPGWLIPTARPLVEVAKTPAGKDVTFDVPKSNSTTPTHGSQWATLDLWDLSKTQAGPQYLHVRTEVLPNGDHKDLNNDAAQPNVDRRVLKGGYKALHYVDFTADGWFTVDCPKLTSNPAVDPKVRPAYSLVAAPDFFPSCGQQELTEWNASNAVPFKLRKQIWSTPPTPLATQRFPANLQLPKSPFEAADNTICALIGLPVAPTQSPNPKTNLALRHSHLPDDAAGVFFPGWDVSLDQLNQGGATIEHLAAYGLGSPFPEDAKLCAALSTFWPAVAPDVTRTMDVAQMANLSGTVAPMTDAEIGRVGDLPWDGVPGPVEINVAGQAFAEYNSFIHADYVRNAIAGKFSLRLTSKIDFTEYSNRVLAMAYSYLALGVLRTNPATNPALAQLAAERRRWVVLSFTRPSFGTPELVQAAIDAGVVLHGALYRITVFRSGNLVVPANFRKRRMPIQDRVELIAAPADQRVLLRRPGQAKWQLGVVKFD